MPCGGCEVILNGVIRFQLLLYHYWRLLGGPWSRRIPHHQQYAGAGCSKETDNRQTMWGGVILFSNELKQEHCDWTETVDLHHPAMEGSTTRKVSSCKVLSWTLTHCVVSERSTSGLVATCQRFSWLQSGCKRCRSDFTVVVHIKFLSNRLYILLNSM